MTTIHTEIKKWGNSLALVIPSENVKTLELEEGEAVDIEIRKCERVNAFGILKGKKPFVRDKDEHEDLW